MATRKNTRKKSQNTKPKTTRKTSAKNKKENTSFIKDEIMILLSLAVCILLTISHFGVGGYIGDAVSGFLFGVFGFTAYIVPIAAFIGIAFVKSNRGNANAYIKTVCGVVTVLMLWENRNKPYLITKKPHD